MIRDLNDPPDIYKSLPLYQRTIGKHQYIPLRTHLNKNLMTSPQPKVTIYTTTVWTVRRGGPSFYRYNQNTTLQTSNDCMMQPAAVNCMTLLHVIGNSTYSITAGDTETGNVSKTRMHRNYYKVGNLCIKCPMTHNNRAICYDRKLWSTR